MASKCFCCEREITFIMVMQPAYDCNYLITDDEAIQRYRIPVRIEKIDYHGPDTLDLIGLRDALQKNQVKRKES